MKKYKWNKRKCIKNMTKLFIKILIIVLVIIYIRTYIKAIHNYTNANINRVIEFSNYAREYNIDMTQENYKEYLKNNK